MKKIFRSIKNKFSKIKYINKNTIFGIIIGLIFGIGGTATAAILIGADEVSYDGKDTSAVSVKEALDELYTYSYNQGGITGVEGLTWEFETGQMNTFVVPLDGYYTVELWGAAGSGTSTYPGGNGAYTKGDIYLNKGEKLYVYVGGKTGFNGGGSYSASGNYGGGATDIRTTAGNWNNSTSLRSRIMVAAGGSGGAASISTWYHNGAPAGGLTGYIGTGGSSALEYRGTIATQTYGGQPNQTYPAQAGGFGYGGSGYNYGSGYSTSGGGSGWYGGSGGSHAGGVAASGSSYISGHDGCVGIDSAGNPSGTSISHTKKYFVKTKMIDGMGYEWTTVRGNEVVGMPSFDGKDTMVGNASDGKAIITFKKMVKEAGYEEKGPTLQKTWSFYASPIAQIFEVNTTGTYKVQLWGAQGGGNSTYPGGNGSYTEGNIFLEKGTKLYIYTGINGNSIAYKGWNGGGTPYAGNYGGGATDIRTISGSWNDTTSLISRIMVAAGGSGGATSYSTWYHTGAPGGGLTGYLGTGGESAKEYRGTIATQIQGGQPHTTYPAQAGGFGYGGAGYNYGGSYATSGGGSGWYGGVGGSHAGGFNSSGSSYISGHEGCIAVDLTGNPTGNSLSNTGLYFVNTKMIDGLGYQWTTIPSEKTKGMPSHDNLTTMSGNSGDGFALITRISEEKEDSNASKIQSAQNEWVYYTATVPQPFEANKDGVYKVELWGASGGGNSSYPGGKGAYTSGEITLKKGDTLYVYTGISGNSTAGKGWNGGGAPYAGNYGGGATDIRIINGEWKLPDSLKTRIMVAAGGSGGATSYSTWYHIGAPAGGLTSYLGTGGSSATDYKGTIATQTRGGQPHTTYPAQAGGFGYGGAGYNYGSSYATSGGGSGWYGGVGGSHAGGLNSSGTSYISGHDGCVGVTQTGAAGSSSISYTGKRFTNTKMIDGMGYQWTTKVGTVIIGNPSTNNRTTEIGHEGDGFARIKYLRAS